MHLRSTSPMMISLSNTSSASYITEMGDAGRGVGITQVVPNPIRGSGLSIDFMEMRKNAPTVAASHSAFQGYLSARVLVDAFQRAGKNLDRTRLKSALESMSVDYYGFKMKFTPSDRHGSDFVELSVVGKDGKLRL
jgi:branched-chain amino acid transport system substrate-binding protein